MSIRSKNRATELKAIPVYFVDDFVAGGVTTSVTTSTTNSSTVIPGTGSNLFIYNRGTDPVDYVIGGGAQDAGVGSPRRLYGGQKTTVPLSSAANLQIGLKAVSGTPIVDFQRGEGQAL